MFSIVTTVCQKKIYSTVLIIFLKIIVGSSVSPQLLAELQIQYIVLIYEKQSRMAFRYSYLIWYFIFYETILNGFRSMFVAFLKDQSSWHKPKSVKLCFCLWYQLKLSGVWFDLSLIYCFTWPRIRMVVVFHSCFQ